MPTAPRTDKITRVAQIGTGYMGGGIAQSLALAGNDVWLADADKESTQRNYERLLKESELFEGQGLFPAGSTEILKEKFHPADSIEEAVADVHFVEEAVFEDPQVKKDVLSRVEKAVTPGTIIGTNTSTIPVKVLAEAFEDASLFLTVHFSNPAPFIPGVELVTGVATNPAVLPLIDDLLVRAGRRGAQVQDVPGFVLNRLQYVLLKEAMTIVEEGVATPSDVDTIVSTTFGFRLPFFGPFAIADMAGLDVYAKGFKVLEGHFGERLSAPANLTALVEAGKFGTKTGSGFLELEPEKLAALIDYRNKAYQKMGELLAELGPSPLAE
ncbi:3-hydroxybutyryl-CoA dehydrogenase [Kineococcus radiotolerans]|uniref:3-hydroxyacyl-CoA dehydrogenase NAD-binding n=2 Tax=Kineococcus radiotolerans TaxID=131568 RepID=A6W9B3_KINRD|nr:3-hydroxyacyl-CoA dehydrogenase family protein [Kineococcus radiotolerans]ABS03402.1 3-hydroxyacyl-CoA dehydrogenase NAD-binding [Kineococcus radiotolerans SRS30216 = ATCC BAA-149]MBB2899480.1 3-hydroxybutyryl-CoA dehydrogenase [Kineococcus radiotolerans]